jgi:hypothetical protein
MDFTYFGIDINNLLNVGFLFCNYVNIHTRLLTNKCIKLKMCKKLLVVLEKADHFCALLLNGLLSRIIDCKIRMYFLHLIIIWRLNILYVIFALRISIIFYWIHCMISYYLLTRFSPLHMKNSLFDILY